MNIFYNLEGVGDTLLIGIQEVDRTLVNYSRHGDVTRIFNGDTNKTCGYNIFNVSKKVRIDGVGAISYNEGLILQLNDIIQTEGYTDTLNLSNEPDFVIGFIKQKEKHPNADKLSICHVDIGDKELQIVCGAPNVDAGQKVVVATVGAVMPSGTIIKEASLRGVPSSGMICSARELDLPDAPQEKGILVLGDERSVGESFFEQQNH